MAKRDFTVLFDDKGEPLTKAISGVAMGCPDFRDHYVDLLSAWKSYRTGKPNPIQGPLGDFLAAQIDCMEQLYRVIWHGWDPISEGLGESCPDSPGELLALLVRPDPPKHKLTARVALDLLRGIPNSPSTPRQRIHRANLARRQTEILDQADSAKLLAAVLELAKRATRGRGSVRYGTVKSALNGFDKAHRDWMRQTRRILKT